MARATEIITMSMREVDRLKTLQAMEDGNLPALIAAKRLGMSKRQVAPAIGAWCRRFGAIDHS